MYWTRLVLVRPAAASLYSASPLKHHPTGKQWCPNPDHYSDSETVRQSLTLMCWALSRAAEPQMLTSFVWRDRGSNHQPPACQTNAQPLHYPAALYREKWMCQRDFIVRLTNQARPPELRWNSCQRRSLSPWARDRANATDFNTARGTRAWELLWHISLMIKESEIYPGFDQGN